MNRVFMIHGWEGSGNNHWFPWLRGKLEEKGCKVFSPDMPNTNNPQREEWILYLRDLVGETDAETYFVGHSLGCQAVMRLLEGKKSVGGSVLVACFLDVDFEDPAESILRPWIDAPLDVTTIPGPIVAIFSDNDKWIPTDEEKNFKFTKEIIILHNMGHFTAGDGVTELPIVLEKLEEMFS